MGGNKAPIPCPECGGPMWDNRGRKKHKNEPDFRCKDKENCPGKVQEYRDPKGSPATKPALTEEEKSDLRKHIAERLKVATLFVTKECTPALKAACEAEAPELTHATQALISTLMIEWGRQGVL